MRRLVMCGWLISCVATAALGCSAGTKTATPAAGWEEEEEEPEFDDGAAGSRGRGERSTDLAEVYFDYDSAAIRGDQRASVDAAVSALASGRYARLVLAGHCDERGSEEYNLALGERRANAVRQQLVDRGVEAARLDTVSYGESRPALLGSGESAWRMNRRVEFSEPL